MRNIFFALGIVAWFTVICSASSYAGSDYPAFKEAFVRSELSAIKKRAEVKGFLDPIVNNKLYYTILKRNHPDLIRSASKNKFNILRLLQYGELKRDLYTESDILILLCTLCIDDYVDIIDSARSLVVRKELYFDVLDKIIFQDFNLTNQVARNYKNAKLQKVLTVLKCDLVAGRISTLNNTDDYVAKINDVLSGKYWEQIKKEEEISPPLIVF